MQSFIQKYLQSALFYLLVATLIMMAGIIFGYLWSGDIGKWLYGSGASVSTTFTVIGSVFTVMTFGLALIAYSQWRHPFQLDKVQRTIDLGQDLLELVDLSKNYSERLLGLLGAKVGNNKIEKNLFTDAALQYESKVIKIHVYNYLLRNLTTSSGISITAKDFSFGDLTETMKVDANINAVQSDSAEYDRLRDLALNKIIILREIGNAVYAEIERMTNELPS